MVLWPCCPGMASAPPPEALSPCFITSKEGEGSPERSCCAQCSQQTSSLLGSASPPSIPQHPTLPPALAPGLVPVPQKNTKPRLTPCWVPACCWYRPPQHLILILHPGKGRGVSLAGNHSLSPAPPTGAALPTFPSPGTLQWVYRVGIPGSRADTSSHIGNFVTSICAQTHPRGPSPGLGPQRLAGEGEGRFLQSLEPSAHLHPHGTELRECWDGSPG